MKITKSHLIKIIKEELREASKRRIDYRKPAQPWRDGGQPPEPTYDSQTEDYIINDLDDLRNRVQALEDGIEMIMGQLTGRESE